MSGECTETAHSTKTPIAERQASDKNVTVELMDAIGGVELDLGEDDLGDDLHFNDERVGSQQFNVLCRMGFALTCGGELLLTDDEILHLDDNETELATRMFHKLVMGWSFK